MISHQPRHQARLVAAEALFQAKGLRVHRAQFGVVAAAALGDVVEQGRKIGDLLARQRLHDLAQHRKFVVEPRDSQAAQIADDEQRVRVHRIGVEQVVLHATDDAAECRNIAAEDAVQIHAAQFMCHPDGRAENLHEEAMVARILPEFLIDEPDMRADQADGFGAHAAQFRMLLQEHEHLEQRRWIAGEHLRMRDFQIIVANLEARIDRHRRRRFA